MILAILLTTLAGIPFGVTHAPESIFAFPAGIGHQFLKVDFMGALNFAYIPFLIALFVPDFFSTFGTVLGVGAKAGYLDKDGNLPGIDKCFKVDAIATSFGALFGIVMKIAAGKIKKVEPVMYVLVAVCLLYFYSII